VKKLEVGNIITPVLPDGTLSAQIGGPDEEMRSGKYRRMVNEKRNEEGNGLSVIHEAPSIFIYPHYFT
jgi:putative aminopeptidase FrvX